MPKENDCQYCHKPFLPVLDKHKDGYWELVMGFEDEKGSYFGFYEERPDGTYSKVGLDTFTHCPTCGRKL